jgi:diacylglycerol kinase (ATP)
MSRRIGVIVNPQAAAGRVEFLWAELEGRIRKRFGDITVRKTGSKGHGTKLARELIKSGHDLVVAVGGDGTLSEVANGILAEGETVLLSAVLGFVPLGTGSDFRRTLGIPAHTEEAIELLATGVPFHIDAGRVAFEGADGSQHIRYFVNVVSFGMGGEVAAEAGRFPRALGGKAAYLGATLKTIATYHGRQIELELDSNGHWLPFFISNVAVGNGQFHGGGMRPCPTAIINDGVLDVTVIGYRNAFEIIRDIRHLYTDRVYRLDKVHHLLARTLRARAHKRTLVEVDGEPLGALPLGIQVLPRRLAMLVPPRSPLLASARER